MWNNPYRFFEVGLPTRESNVYLHAKTALFPLGPWVFTCRENAVSQDKGTGHTPTTPAPNVSYME
jgi:hypothetical protein